MSLNCIINNPNSLAFFILLEVLLISLVINISVVFDIVDTTLPPFDIISFSNCLSLKPVNAIFLPISFLSNFLTSLTS